MYFFIIRDLKIKENTNQIIIDSLNKMSRKKETTTKAFLNKCLFVINCDDNQKFLQNL